MPFTPPLDAEIIHLEGAVVDHALAVAPRALRAIGLVREVDDRPAAAGAHLVADESCRRYAAPSASHPSCMNSSEPSRSRTETVMPCVPRMPCSAGTWPLEYGLRSSSAIPTSRVADAAGVRELQRRLAEALGVGDLEAVLLQPGAPEGERAPGDGERDGADLAPVLGALCGPTGAWEARDEGGLVAEIVAVIEVEDRLLAIVESSLLHALQTEDLGVEVVVLLSAADVQGQVMVTADVRIEGHVVLP